MASKDTYETLLGEISELDARARRVQGESEIVVDDTYLEALLDDYVSWYGRALALLPDEFHEKFIDLYEGGHFVRRIKAFLQAPGATSPFWNADQKSELIPFWEFPYETTFHTSILEQRQLLTLAKQRSQQAHRQAEVDLVVQVVRGFPALVAQLRHRHDNRASLTIDDEYDVQDLLGAVLAMLFGDVRREDPSPQHAGGSSRVDFFLKDQEILVEVKMTRPGLRDRDITKQLIEDIERYRSHPDWSAFVGFVYDPARHIRNPRGIETDLSGQREGLTVQVAVVSG